MIGIEKKMVKHIEIYTLNLYLLKFEINRVLEVFNLFKNQLIKKLHGCMSKKTEIV